MPLTEAELADDLARAGLVFLGLWEQQPELPTPPDRGAASSLREHGRFDSSAVSIDDPEFVSRINAEWWRMATSYELFDERREFLLCVDLRDPGAVDGEPRWARVRLSGRVGDGEVGLSVAGGACGQLRGWLFEEDGRELWVPEFSALSLDSRMLIHTTLWGDYTVSVIVVRPDRV
ncbi:hypothetical protein [Lentzea waywayandensis]|uniref:hypothetical protein n=1 Tax=Lentzea waywayandensis TaxID=84724 RepID=UPI0015A5DB31|nr:hypothetical protein [Lentzea waywayandensis]